MDMQRVVDILKNEKECVKRQSRMPFGQSCNRECGNCDLVLPTDDVLQAYTLAIGCIEGVMNEVKTDDN